MKARTKFGGTERNIPLLVEKLLFFYFDPLILDIDECSSNSHNCDSNAVCNNTRGSHTCACKAGYLGDGTNCIGRLILLNNDNNNNNNNNVMLLRD